MQTLYIIIGLAVISLIYYKFYPVKSVEERFRDLFKLDPGEKILHKTVGFQDPNAHLTRGESVKKNAGLYFSGSRLKGSIVMNFALTDQNRFVVYSPVLEGKPIYFSKQNVPKIIDTGQTPKRSALVMENPLSPEKLEKESRIVQIDSPDIPPLYISENKDIFEANIPIDFIPLLMDWVKKNEKKF